MADDLTARYKRSEPEHSGDRPGTDSHPAPWDGAVSPTPHADKFKLALAALVGIAVGALAIAAAVLVAHDTGTGASARGGTSADSVQWSTWKPSTGGNTGAAEIADYVAPFYRLSASQQLAVITPVSTTELDASTGAFTGSGLTVALNTASGGSDDLRPLVGETVAYDLCGQGTSNCAVGGTPSTTRLLLLRREALELALYTFRYLPHSENVAVVLPPSAKTSKTAKAITVAVLFSRSELAAMLVEPVDATLEEYPPDVGELSAWKKTEEAELVDTVTSRNLFSESVEAEQTGGSLLVLDPLPAQ